MASRVNSRVARRILLLFVLASLIPLATLAAVTFYKVRSDLVDEVGKGLRESAKSVAMDLHLRLELAGEQIQLMTESATENGLQANALEAGTPMPRFSRIWIAGQRSRSILKGNGDDVLPDVEFSPGTTLPVLQDSSGGVEVLIARSFLVEGEKYQLIAQFDPDLLWENVIGYSERICLITPDLITVFCNGDVPDELRRQVRQRYQQRDSGFFLEAGYYTAYWSLFESGIDGAPVFIAVAATPEATAMGGIRDFESIFAQIVGLTLLLIAFVSMRAIRSNMDPLEKLLAATRMLSDGHFASRVELDTGDEFEELGGSFNMMADRLGRQFDLQSTISRLGQQLQEAGTIEQTIELIFATTDKIVDCNWMMVTYIVTEGGVTSSHVFSISATGETVHTEREEAEAPRLPKTITVATGAELTAEHSLFGSKLQEEQRYCFVPGIKDGEVIAALVFDMNAGPGIDDSIRLFLMQVGVLLASSLANVFLSRTLYYQAHHDLLTGLPNRLFIKNFIEEEMKPGAERALVVSIFDIDRFKLINDTQGHAAGDELLNQVGKRLKKHLGKDVVPSRFAGDEFIVVSLQESADLEENEIMEKLVKPINKVFAEPFQIGNSRLNVEASLGLARYPQDGEEFVTLLKNADAAMYEAKRNNPGGFRFYSGEIEKKLKERLDLELALSVALEENQLELYYQPVVDLCTRSVIGAETLMRWNRPGHGIIMPTKFIGIAEETGIIVPMGTWSMIEASTACKRWLDAGAEVATIAVNVSGMQLAEDDFVDVVKRCLEITGLPPRYLELEVTETSLVENIEETIRTLEAVRSLGVRIAVDDFGTGYSSLQYVKRLPLDKLKIDQMFIRGLPDDQSDIAIIKTLVALARELDLTVLAEGCETERQAQFLLSESITQVQGWLFSHAVREAEFLKYLGTHSAGSEAAHLARPIGRG